jgi:hypothetical protein
VFIITICLSSTIYCPAFIVSRIKFVTLVLEEGGILMQGGIKAKQLGNSGRELPLVVLSHPIP